MATAARLDIASRRNEARVFTMRIIGIDLTGVEMRQQVRGERDAPGLAMIDLATVTSPTAQGIRLASVTIENGLPVSTINFRYNMTTMREELPYAGEVGEDAKFVHAVQFDGITRFFGDWWAVASAIDSDSSPLDRPGASSFSRRAPAILSGVAVTFSDDVIEVTLADAALLSPIVAQAEAARDAVKPLYGAGDPASDLGIDGSWYRDITDLLDPIEWFKTGSTWQRIGSLRGSAGPTGNTATTLADLKAAPLTNRAMILQGRTFYAETANAPYTANDTSVVKQDDTDLSVGAWVLSTQAVEVANLPLNLAMRLILPSGQEVAAFAEGGSVGFGDAYADGDVNPHAGDEITRVVSVRSAVGAPLFLGLTDRPNDEAGGAVGRSMLSVEAYRMTNDAGYRDMGGLRVISQGASTGKWGGRVALIGRPDGFSTVENFHELFSVYNASQSAGAGSAHAYLGIAALSGVATANRTGVAPTTALLTMAGSTGATLELVTGAADAAGETAGEILAVHNQNGGGDKRVGRIIILTEGSAAGNRGGVMRLQVKSSGGVLMDNLTLSASASTPSAAFAGRWACNGASPQGAATMNSPSPATTNPAASDLDSAIALVNELQAKSDAQQVLITQIRTALIANGIGVAP